MDNDQFDHLVQSALVEEAAVRRGRRDWLRRQVAEEATLAGVLLDLAEAGAGVVLRTRGGRTRHGRLLALGSDHVAVGGGRVDAFIRLDALVSVASATGTGPVTGDRVSTAGRSLRSVLADLGARRATVQLRLEGGGAALSGSVVAVGRDLVTLGSGVGAGAVVTYVPVGAIDELVVT